MVCPFCSSKSRVQCFRESLGLDVVTSEDGAAWLAFLRSLVVRGLTGVKLCTSDAHPGLVDAGLCDRRKQLHGRDAFDAGPHLLQYPHRLAATARVCWMRAGRTTT